MDAIVLAGGLGKRLKNITSNIPKPMALVNKKPFLDYIFKYLQINGVEKVILSVHYKSDIIKMHYGYNYDELIIMYSEDKALLGTGGAIKEALLKSTKNNVFVINGDTYFNVDLKYLLKEHIKMHNDITISLKPMKNFKRYGYVKTDLDGSITSFEEKKFQKYGKIDGGIYLLKKNIFHNYKGSEYFPFNDYIKNNLEHMKIGTVSFDELFIDIGTPEDYNKAQNIFLGY